METFHLVEQFNQPTKKGDPFPKLKVRYTQVNKDGVPIELWEGNAPAAKGITYKAGQELKIVHVYGRNVYGDIQVTGFRFLPK